VSIWTLANGRVTRVVRDYHNHIRPTARSGGARLLEPPQGKARGCKRRDLLPRARGQSRQDRQVTLCYDSRLYKIGLGRAYNGRQIKLLIADRDVRVIDLNGELTRELELDPSRVYQPLSRV
jgi:hypothetical protein